ncbi:anti-sigma factor family protein [Gloeocapsopsis dulcis]|uniref:Fis family transcriptional regulator n=1 Tax=Gloeocapsopsis dulcis AAB1 = 1H9 TaxID=1433147 RepID=A0A6N8FX39_9CHRO|nr:Fis family transcriptional regulator [Gloeocapsopsis dulcis]MUL37678.1 Fis family transcriptional regulator [Gloeocapsopsis dulcis AAB1 = 1H9]WNN88491.1 Fis family transcriptional regulator [Gloeocapsopsis dulcis]
MTSEIKLPHKQPRNAGLQAIHTGYTNQPMGAMDRCQRDRFELLSAFLDGEVTAAERQQVEEWLANDAEIQRLYARLLKLRQGIKTLPTPPEQQPVEQTVQQVFTRIEQRRSRRVALWGKTAVAAMFVGALSGIFTGRPSLQIAGLQLVPEVNETLMVAVNSPVIEIPKAAVVAPKPHFINQADYRYE